MSRLPLLPAILVAGGVLDFLVALAIHLYRTRLLRRCEDVRRRWHQVPARILSSRLAEKKDKEGTLLYSPEIRYEYQVDGRRYETDRWSVFPDWSGSDRVPHEKIVAQFPPGRDVTTWVNPRDPAEAVLSMDSPLPKTLRLILIVVMGAGFMTILGGALFWIFRPEFPS
jgi:hypothetical protein